MKRFLDIFATEVMGIAADSDAHPYRVLQAIEVKSPANARKGLRMAVNDFVEMCEGQSAEYVARLDERLRSSDAMTLTEARAQFSKGLRAALKRGRIVRQGEYYLVRNAVDAAEPEMASKMWAMLAAYEEELVSNG